MPPNVVREHVNRLVERLRELAARDPSTGVLNRRAPQERLLLEVRRSRRAGTRLSVLAGDAALASVATGDHARTAARSRSPSASSPRTPPAGAEGSGRPMAAAAA